VQANSASVPAIIAKGATSQSANIQEWQNVDGTSTLASISSAGVFNTQNNIRTGFANLVSGARSLAFYSNGSISTTATATITTSGGTGSLNGSMAITATGGVGISGVLSAIPATPLATTSADNVGYMGMPQNRPNDISGDYAYTFQLSDAGKHFYVYPTATPVQTILTIPANTTTAFEIGTTIVIVNDISPAAANPNVSIRIAGTDTMVFAGDGATGTRTLARFGMATIVKVSATRWIISGNGLS